MALREEPVRAAILTGQLVRAFPKHQVYQVARDVQRMQHYATILQNIAVRYCNGYRDDSEQARDERKTALVRAKFLDILTQYPGVTAKFGGDPRGNVVKIDIPGTRGGDDWGREGFGVFR
jgi:hypothetical protein